MASRTSAGAVLEEASGLGSSQKRERSSEEDEEGPHSLSAYLTPLCFLRQLMPHSLGPTKPGRTWDQCHATERTMLGGTRN